MGETAYYPWSQEFIPNSVRGWYSAIATALSTFASALALLVAGVVIDSGSGLSRFLWLIGIGTLIGLLGIITMKWVPGGAPDRSEGQPASHFANMRGGAAQPEPERLPERGGRGDAGQRAADQLFAAVSERTDGSSGRDRGGSGYGGDGGRGIVQHFVGLGGRSDWKPAGLDVFPGDWPAAAGVLAVPAAPGSQRGVLVRPALLCIWRDRQWLGDRGGPAAVQQRHPPGKEHLVYRDLLCLDGPDRGNCPAAGRRDPLVDRGHANPVGPLAIDGQTILFILSFLLLGYGLIEYSRVAPDGVYTTRGLIRKLWSRFHSSRSSHS